ncbi:flavin reductase family protein [Propionibacteriaceae bacterium Y1923]|uniref:flavin reductase family protein n=1 Tax=Aestuariimicrobium sp. Y1814 TaxID=3418742 RepID=UPI003C23AA47
MTIHTDHPFLDAERVLGRQFRGRLGNRVSLWTTGELSGGATSAAGLTVSSLLVIPGEPWRVVGFIDPDSGFADAVAATGTAVVSLLEWHHRGLADMFGGVAPAPGGAFTHAEFEQTDHGPRLVDAPTWAGVTVESVVDVGWTRQLTCVADEFSIGPDESPLHHTRGRYRSLTPPG